MTPLLPEVQVNGVTIPAARIAAEAQQHPAPKGKPGLAWQAAARALALREVLLQEARARGLTAEPQETAPGQWETAEEALVRQLLDLEVRPAPVAEADLRALWQADPDRFRAPPLWEAAHILFAAPEGEHEARHQARAAADAALATLTLRPKAWDDLARNQSGCSSGRNGGRLGQIGPGDTLPDFEAALRAMQPGQIAGPVETRHGLHLIRLIAVAEGEVLPFAAILPRLRLAAEKAAWARAARDYAARLLDGASVTGVALRVA